MRLVHCTNYWGEHINGTDNDDEVSFDAIWVQGDWTIKAAAAPASAVAVSSYAMTT